MHFKKAHKFQKLSFSRSKVNPTTIFSMHQFLQKLSVVFKKLYENLTLRKIFCPKI